MIPTRSGGLSPGESWLAVIRVVLEFSHAIRQILFIMSQHNGLRRLLAREVARATRKVLPSTAHAAAQREAKGEYVDHEAVQYLRISARPTHREGRWD